MKIAKKHAHDHDHDATPKTILCSMCGTKIYLKVSFDSYVQIQYSTCFPLQKCQSQRRKKQQQATATALTTHQRRIENRARPILQSQSISTFERWPSHTHTSRWMRKINSYSNLLVSGNVYAQLFLLCPSRGSAIRRRISGNDVGVHTSKSENSFNHIPW